MKEKETVVVKEIFGYQFSGRKGIITEVDNNGFNVLLDLGVEIYFNEDEIEIEQIKILGYIIKINYIC